MAANARGPTRKDLKYLLGGLQTDVEFLVGDCPCTRIKAHKLILAMRNDVFETMFYGSMPEEGDVIIPDLHPNGFREFLSYLYSHEAKFADVETALLTKSAAQKYLDLNLVGLCTEFVRKSIKPETLCFVLDVLAVSDEPMSEYDGAINEILRTRAGEVLDSKAFISASVVTILEILRRKKRVSEYEVLRGIHAWAAVKCSAVADTPSDKMKDLLSELLSLTLGEFVEGPAHWKIFTEVEAYRILSNIIKRGSMPLSAFCKK